MDAWECACVRAYMRMCLCVCGEVLVCVCVYVWARYRATLTSGPYGLGFRAWNILRLMFIYKHTPRRTRLRDPCPSPTYSHHHHSSSVPLFIPCSFHPHVFLSRFCYFSLQNKPSARSPHFLFSGISKPFATLIRFSMVLSLFQHIKWTLTGA